MSMIWERNVKRNYFTDCLLEMRQPNNGNSKGCPQGYTYRKGYTRKMRKDTLNQGYTVQRKGQFYTVKVKKNTVEIPSACVKNRQSAVQNTQEALRKGSLIKYGYSFKLSDGSRKTALKKAVEAYGAKKVYSKLALVAKLSSKSQPKASIIFAEDAKFVKAHFPFWIAPIA